MYNKNIFSSFQDDSNVLLFTDENYTMHKLLIILFYYLHLNCSHESNVQRRHHIFNLQRTCLVALDSGFKDPQPQLHGSPGVHRLAAAALADDGLQKQFTQHMITNGTYFLFHCSCLLHDITKCYSSNINSGTKQANKKLSLKQSNYRYVVRIKWGFNCGLFKLTSQIESFYVL